MSVQTDRYLLYVVTFLVALLMAFGLWAYFLQRPTLSYPQPQLLVKREPKAGEPVTLIVERCNSSGDRQVYLISRRLVRLDKKQRDKILETSPVDVPPGCSTAESNANVIPVGTVPGQYMVAGISIVPGIGRTFLVEWHSAPFQVREE